MCHRAPTLALSTHRLGKTRNFIDTIKSTLSDIWYVFVASNSVCKHYEEEISTTVKYFNEKICIEHMFGFSGSKTVNNEVY